MGEWGGGVGGRWLSRQGRSSHTSLTSEFDCRNPLKKADGVAPMILTLLWQGGRKRQENHPEAQGPVQHEREKEGEGEQLKRACLNKAEGKNNS